MISFNISASSYSLFKESPLVFYYKYIVKAKPDTKTIGVYGDAGNVVHNILDEYHKDKTINIDDKFNEYWENKHLSIRSGFNGNPLSKEIYREALDYGIRLSDNVYNIIKTEEEIILPFYKNIKLKGYLDFIAEKDGEIIIGDWKTNNSFSDFTTHAKMYALLYYKKHNKLPVKLKYEYLKLGKSKTYRFTLDDIMDFEEELLEFSKNIYDWGTDMSFYDIGNIDSPFNEYKKRCIKEKSIRESITNIVMTLKNNRLYFNKIPDIIRKIIKTKYSYFVDGFVFSKLYKKHLWDGKKYLLRNDSLPYGLINDLKILINDYNEYKHTKYKLIIIDERDEDITNKVFTTKFKSSNIKLRSYQEDAIKSFLNNKIGIIAIGCGGGKSIIAAELIKRLNRRTLLIVNNVQLAKQTKEVFEDYLGVEVGFMTDGKLIINKQITVASVQTIHSILKRKNKDSKLLLKYLYNISFIIADEVQNVSDSKLYKSIYNNTSNVVYCLGLSGSPYRNGNDTIEMNAFVGFPIYWKLTDELTKDGYLVPTKVLFISDNVMINSNHNKYSDAYGAYIVDNYLRNKIIIDLVNKFKDSKKILVLVKRINHGEKLLKLINNSYLINGKTSKKNREEVYDKFMNKKGVVLIGSTKIFSAGINIPDLDIIINLTAHKSSIDSIQIIGRVKRLNKGKTCGYYIDFVDSSAEFFNTAAQERMNILEKYGEKVNIRTIKEIMNDEII